MGWVYAYSPQQRYSSDQETPHIAATEPVHGGERAVISSLCPRLVMRPICQSHHEEAASKPYIDEEQEIQNSRQAHHSRQS